MEGRGRGRGGGGFRGGRGGAGGGFRGRGGARGGGGAGRSGDSGQAQGQAMPQLNKSVEFEVHSAVEAPKTFPDFPGEIKKLAPFSANLSEDARKKVSARERQDLDRFFVNKKHLALLSVELCDLYAKTSFSVMIPEPEPEIEKWSNRTKSPSSKPLPSAVVDQEAAMVPSELFPTKKVKAKGKGKKRGKRQLEEEDALKELMDEEQNALLSGELEDDAMDISGDDKDEDNDVEPKPKKRKLSESDAAILQKRKLGKANAEGSNDDDEDEDDGDEEEEEEDDDDEEEEESSAFSSENEKDWKRNDDDDDGGGGSDGDDGGGGYD